MESRGNGLGVLIVLFVLASGALLGPRLVPSLVALGNLSSEEFGIIPHKVSSSYSYQPQPPSSTSCLLNAAREVSIGVTSGATTFDMVQVAVASVCGLTSDGDALLNDPDMVMRHSGTGEARDVLNPGRPTSPTLDAVSNGQLDAIPSDMFVHNGQAYKVVVAENSVGELGIVHVLDSVDGHVAAEVQFMLMDDMEFGKVIVSFIDNYDAIPGFGARLSQVEDHLLFNWAKTTGQSYVRRFALATHASKTRLGTDFLEACGCTYFMDPFEAVKVIDPKGLGSLGN